MNRYTRTALMLGLDLVEAENERRDHQKRGPFVSPAKAMAEIDRMERGGK